jgi:hypothetical protein
VRKLRILKNVVSGNVALDFDVIQEKQAYDIRLHRDCGIEPVSDALSLGRLWYGGLATRSIAAAHMML